MIIKLISLPKHYRYFPKELREITLYLGFEKVV